MTNYSDRASMCRVDFFREGGKWYTTEAIDFGEVVYEQHPASALMDALRRQLGGRLAGLWAVCLEPYVKQPFPVMVQVPAMVGASEPLPEWPEDGK